MKYGFIRIASAIPMVRVGDCRYNCQQIGSLITEAHRQQAEVVVFPELSVSGYTCADLFMQSTLLESAQASLLELIKETATLPITVIVGAPVEIDSVLYNMAVVFRQGEIMGMVPKTYIPNYHEFYEKRWFNSGSKLAKQPLYYLWGQAFPITSSLLFQGNGYNFGIELCEDVWSVIPPSSQLALQGADLLFNLSASDEVVGKHQYLVNLLAQQSARCMAGYIYSSCGFGESSTDLVFGGNALIFENGKLLAQSERFSTQAQLVISEIDIDRLRMERRSNTTFASAQEKFADEGITVDVTSTPVEEPAQDFQLSRHFAPQPFVPNGEQLSQNCEDILSIQVAGLAQRLQHIHCSRAVIGISGGLDSTLALLSTVRTFDKLDLSRRNIIGITMPGFGTTDRTYRNAIHLMQSLGITLREISIKEACIQHFKDIEHDVQLHDVTYENSQARERTQILMDVANQENAIVIGTGDLSELALGWATYNGDHMSMYGINCSIPKTLVKHLVHWIALNQCDVVSKDILLDIIDTPISPELIPADEKGDIQQKTEDLVGPYELHDFFLYHFLRSGYRPRKIYYLACETFRERYNEDTIRHWLKTFFRRFFQQQFKRSCLPDGPKVGSVSLSPRGDWRMPSDACSALWLEECEQL